MTLRFKDAFRLALLSAVQNCKGAACSNKVLYLSMSDLKRIARMIIKMDTIFEDLKRKKRCKNTMQMEIDCEFEQFKDDFENGLVHKTYLDEYFYSDNFSGSEIIEAQEELAGLIKNYLHINAPGEYLLYVDWSVRVISKKLKSASSMSKEHIVY